MITLIIAVSLLMACGNGSLNTSKVSVDTVEDTILRTARPFPYAEVKNDSSVLFDFGPGDTTTTVSATVNYQGHGKQITCSITIHKPCKLEAWLYPESDKANIRFNQVVMPGGATDGPFGNMLNYNLKKKGSYQLIIGESLMAGNDWKGKLDIRVSLRK